MDGVYRPFFMGEPESWAFAVEFEGMNRFLSPLAKGAKGQDLWPACEVKSIAPSFAVHCVSTMGQGVIRRRCLVFVSA